MSAPKRIQLRRTKGWRKPPGVIVCTRPHSPYANPFRVVYLGPRRWQCNDAIWPTKAKASAEAARLFRAWILDDHLPSSIRERTWAPLFFGAARDRILNDAPHLLRGHDLACWCALDAPCHVDTVLEVANR